MEAGHSTSAFNFGHVQAARPVSLPAGRAQAPRGRVFYGGSSLLTSKPPRIDSHLSTAALATAMLPSAAAALAAVAAPTRLSNRHSGKVQSRRAYTVVAMLDRLEGMVLGAGAGVAAGQPVDIEHQSALLGKGEKEEEERNRHRHRHRTNKNRHQHQRQPSLSY